MKIIYSDLPADYGTYTFPHAVYAQAETDDEMEAIYQGGFLPYTADIDIETPTFYLARSLRIDLEKFIDSSENRRVDKLCPFQIITIDFIPKSDFNFQDSAMLHLCKEYIGMRFSDGAMSPDRFEYILHHPLTTHFLVYKSKEGHIKAIVFCSVHLQSVHYWFAFLDLPLMEFFPFGKWIMWKTIHWAKENDYSHLYLGTCYGSKSLYKARDFKGVEFFDGQGWNNDMKELKRRAHEDEKTFIMDRWKRENLF